jgi:transcription-repair coupling factor (superfamily II helicase)
VKDLLKTVQLRWKGKKRDFEKLMLKNGQLKAYLPEHDKVEYYQSNIFGAIIKYLQTNHKTAKLKETKTREIFTIDDVESVDKGMECLDGILV